MIEMINGPAVVLRRTCLSDPLLARNQNPAPRVARLHLLAVQQFGIVGDQLLEFIFSFERLLLERFEPCLAPGVNPLGHFSLSVWAEVAF